MCETPPTDPVIGSISSCGVWMRSTVPTRGDSCVCGQRRRPVLEVVDDDDRTDLYAWERRNIARSQDGYPHGLPQDHLNYRDWRYRA